MLYEEIRLGCEAYHSSDKGKSYDRFYRSYLRRKDQGKWKCPETLDYDEVDKAIYFVNQWGSRVGRGRRNVECVLSALRGSVPNLNSPRDHTLLEVPLDDRNVSELITESFHHIASSFNRYESTATSKILHAAVNPNLFVMWDDPIRDDYGSGYTGTAYVKFLARMQYHAQEAVKQVMTEKGLSCNNAIKFLTPCGNTLAKVIDEYNFVRVHC